MAPLAILTIDSDYIAHLDGTTEIAGGWLNKNWIQLGYQIADSVAGGAYSFGGTCLILGVLGFLGHWIPAFKLRATEEEEILGIDDVEIGEFAYDYVELAREAKTPDEDDAMSHHSVVRTDSHEGREKNHDSMGSQHPLG